MIEASCPGQARTPAPPRVHSAPALLSTILSSLHFLPTSLTPGSFSLIPFIQAVLKKYFMFDFCLRQGLAILPRLVLNS